MTPTYKLYGFCKIDDADSKKYYFANGVPCEVSNRVGEMWCADIEDFGHFSLGRMILIAHRFQFVKIKEEDNAKENNAG